MTLLLDFGTFFDDNITEHLLFKTLHGNSEIDQSNLDAHFWRIVRIWLLRCHVKLEAVSEGIWLFTIELDLFGTILTHEFLVQKNGVQGGINLLLQILNEKRLSIVDTIYDSSEPVVRSELDAGQILGSQHILDPLVSLALRINAQTVSFGLGGQNTVFKRNTI